ncbi:MAG: hypothetical protein KC731_40055 [Myxococcales bacterium]|nr:hypothetical protein [Myxococcales bacterium]
MAQDRGDGEFWIDHAEIGADDLEWLGRAERLTLWNVLVPEGFLGKLKSLWWLDLRGGTATDLKVATGCKRLRYLQVNQVRGMRDLSQLPSFRTLELLSLYGLSKVETLPSLKVLKNLRRVEMGQMKGLESLGTVLDAPSLEELYVIKRVGITEADVRAVNRHKKLARFGWSTEDVPRKVCEPVLEKIDKPEARAMHAIDWFREPRKRRK